ncbi:MAG TPA: hypothetical protein PKO36_15530 [Candidatus Hydrogenedentes bacterium]|nr:hypothetical protein [Candidatus Hydrogenedentota bacterium]HOV72922.1 hypothetical protein [Candidatus Hydrogenedentota bacterium]HPC15770.1 hypothetical protein [Candidatus Hydrogenedentota bacterium]HRT19822.1 hypothetical protein [Candidatus Hydrogenedentota bacterium]HRT64595.1 hypothetical protein [Candidatus Hydrogenedentota bacterium]
MKSAYELAMERLEKTSGPTKKLSDEQKARMAEIEKRFEARIAEQKLSHEDKLRAAGSLEDFNRLKAELAEAIAALEAQRDREKEIIWNSE